MAIRSVASKTCSLAVEEAARLSDMSCDGEPEICISKTQELLTKAQLLLKDIEERLECCTVTGPSNQGRGRMVQQKGQASIEEDGESLVVEGFRFESAASSEDLRRLSSQTGARGTSG
ncbi:uncharacterized protein AB9X84_024091 isoform 1-T4 [Acanthopagrus schlegelii]